MSPGLLNRFAKEPLFHFLLLGTLLFVLFRFTSKPAGSPQKQIVVNRARIENFVVSFSNAWGRPPTDAELHKMIDDYIRQEICCHEAVALGFDRDDDVIRNRLIQNLQIVPDQIAAQANPSDAELRAFMMAHPDLFSVGRSFTFLQVFMNPEYHRGTLPADAAALVSQLNKAGTNIDLAKVGDPFAMEHTFRNISSLDVAKQFGETFAAKLDELPIGQWEGPLESGTHFHLVYIVERHEGQMPGLDAARADVRREWNDAHQQQVREEFYQTLRKQYNVVVEAYDPASRQGGGATPGK